MSSIVVGVKRMGRFQESLGGVKMVVKTNEVMVSMSKVIACQFSQFMIGVNFSEIKRIYKRANKFGDYAQELDADGQSEMSDKMYNMYLDVLTDAQQKLGKIEDDFIKANEMLISAVDGITADDFRKYFEIKTREWLNK